MTAGVGSPYRHVIPSRTSLRRYSSGLSPSGTSNGGSRVAPSFNFRSTWSATSRGVASECGAHLLRRLQVVLLRGEAPPVRVVEAGAGLKAQQHVVRLRVMAVDVVQVVGGAETEAELLAKFRERHVDRVLPVYPVSLHLEQEPVLAEDVAVRGHRFARAVDVSVRDAARGLALQAAG